MKPYVPAAFTSRLSHLGPRAPFYFQCNHLRRGPLWCRTSCIEARDTRWEDPRWSGKNASWRGSANHWQPGRAGDRGELGPPLRDPTACTRESDCVATAAAAPVLVPS